MKELIEQELLPVLEESVPAGKWKVYEEYRDSGVEWLGEIPAHWEARKIKFLASLETRKYFEKPDNLSYIGLEHIESGTGKLIQNTPIENVESTMNYFAKGNVLFGKLRPYLAKVILTDFEGVCTTELLVFQPTPHLYGKYLYYRLISSDFIGLINSITYGTKMPRASSEQVCNISVQCPSLFEQQAIATFLDHQTARIHQLIAYKERLIELLQERRTAVINQAVTRGLNANVEMKDSGVEWLGKIPAHWEVRRLKKIIYSIEQGWSPACENRLADDEEWGVLKVGCVNGNEFNDKEHKALPKDIKPIMELEIRTGDILMSRANTRELLGSTSIVHNARSKLLLCDKLYRINLSQAVLLPTFFVLAMKSSIVRFQLEREATGASNSMQNISQFTILNLLLPVPDIKQQEEILSYLAQETAKIDKLISVIQDGIKKLKEYNTALISAVVTGKIDVRGEVDGVAGEEAAL